MAQPNPSSTQAARYKKLADESLISKPGGKAGRPNPLESFAGDLLGAIGMEVRPPSDQHFADNNFLNPDTPVMDFLFNGQARRRRNYQAQNAALQSGQQVEALDLENAIRERRLEQMDDDDKLKALQMEQQQLQIDRMIHDNDRAAGMMENAEGFFTKFNELVGAHEGPVDGEMYQDAVVQALEAMPQTDYRGESEAAFRSDEMNQALLDTVIQTQTSRLEETKQQIAGLANHAAVGEMSPEQLDKMHGPKKAELEKLQSDYESALRSLDLARKRKLAAQANPQYKRLDSMLPDGRQAHEFVEVGPDGVNTIGMRLKSPGDAVSGALSGRTPEQSGWIGSGGTPYVDTGIDDQLINQIASGDFSGLDAEPLIAGDQGFYEQWQDYFPTMTEEFVADDADLTRLDAMLHTTGSNTERTEAEANLRAQAQFTNNAREWIHEILSSSPGDVIDRLKESIIRFTKGGRSVTNEMMMMGPAYSRIAGLKRLMLDEGENYVNNWARANAITDSRVVAQARRRALDDIETAFATSQPLEPEYSQSIIEHAAKGLSRDQISDPWIWNKDNRIAGVLHYAVNRGMINNVDPVTFLEGARHDPKNKGVDFARATENMVSFSHMFAMGQLRRDVPNIEIDTDHVLSQGRLVKNQNGDLMSQAMILPTGTPGGTMKVYVLEDITGPGKGVHAIYSYDATHLQRPRTMDDAEYDAMLKAYGAGDYATVARDHLFKGLI